MIFQAKNKKLLMAALAMRQDEGAASAPRSKKVNGKLSGVPFQGVITPDRSVCSYLAAIDDTRLVVTNSKVQLERLIKTSKGDIPSIASLDEYVFFRDRYKIGQANETAFLVLSDDTIRKWCGPRWRIADSRRTRAAAAMMEIQAQVMAKSPDGKLKPSTYTGPLPLPGMGKIHVTPNGVTSSVYGSLEFLTPICELPMTKVTKGEAEAYEWFRKNYQNRWQQYFDPIAFRFFMTEDAMELDLSVRPVISNGAYPAFMEVAGQVELYSTDGDPHKETILHFIMALDPQSRQMRELNGFATMATPKLGANSLSWLGQWVSFYVDQSPFWAELEAAVASGDMRSAERFMEANYNRLPLALQIGVSNGLKLSLFLSALRGFIQQTGPGLTTWENFTHKGLPYVRIQANNTRPRGRERDKENKPEFEIFYSAAPDALVISLNEDTIKGYLQRVADTAAGKSTDHSRVVESWLGKSMCLKIRNTMLKSMRVMYGSTLRTVFQQRAWANIAILNEWRRRFRQSDPLQFHRRYWQTLLVCPGGGEYIWNETFQTMESTIFGHPGQPKISKFFTDPLEKIYEAQLGLTFEDNGLRARGKWLHKEPKR